MEKCQLQRLLDSVLEGYSSAVMACGQTGSGKTYTMCGRNEGRNGDDDQGDGLIAYTVTYLYEAIRKQSSMKGRKVFTLKASYYEVYNEQVNDLLRLDCAPREVKWNVKEGFYVDNLLLVDCESIEDVFSVLNEGAKNRKVGSHELNKDSSRSHCIMTLHVESTIDMAEGPPVVRYGKMLFVDLAGSERLKKSRSSGDMLKETGNINRSLFTLGKVISALAEGKKGDLVPYRESMLTKLLMESLGGNSLALMIACISPASSAVDETLSTLYYATCTKTIVNVPSINIDERDKVIVGLRKEIDMLKEENKLLRSRLGIPAEGELDQSTVSSQRNSDGHGGSALPLSLTNFPNSIGSIGGEKSKVLVSGLSNTQSGWMLDKERMLTQLRTAERLLSKKMPLKSPTDIQETFQERNLHQGERAAIIEGIENIPNRTYSFSSMHPKQTDSDDLFKEKSVDCNSGSRGRSEETGRQKNQISMTGKSNGLVVVTS